MGDIQRRGDIEINITDRENQNYAEVNTEGRLKVDASFTGGVQAVHIQDGTSNNLVSVNSSGQLNVNPSFEHFVPFVTCSSDNIYFTSGEIKEILNIDMCGKLDEIMLRFDEKDFDVILNIDGQEVYNLNLDKLKNDYNLTSKTELMGIGVLPSAKQFFDVYSVPVDVRNNITIKVKNNNNKTKKVYAYMLRMRKLVS